MRRIVGDSNEVIGDYDLVLITSPVLEHVWEQHECKSAEIREITIQFKFGMGDNGEDDFFSKNPFANIRKMMHRAQSGLAFPIRAIMKVYDKLDSLSSIQDRFAALMQFLDILNTLAMSDGAHTLATSSFAKVNIEDDSRRVLKVKKYIQEHYMEAVSYTHLDVYKRQVYGQNWKWERGRSDVKEVCGDYPAVMGFELGGIELGHEANIDQVPFDRMRDEIIEQHLRGGCLLYTSRCV